MDSSTVNSSRERSHRAPLRTPVLLLALMSLAVAACGDDPASPPANTLVIPKTGSSFTMQVVSRDQSGRLVDSRELTTVIEAHGLTIDGRTGVVRALTKNITQLLHYSDNGDLSSMFIRSIGRPNADTSWMLLPFGSKGVSDFPPDTGVGLGIQTAFRAQARYARDERITVAGEEFDTKVVYVEQHAAVLVDGDLVQSESRYDTAFFAPRIGYYVRQLESQIVSYGGPDVTKYYNTGNLVRYSLK